MQTAGKFCTPSSPREYLGFSTFYLIIEPPHMNLSSSSSKFELDRTVIQPIKQVAPRSSIRSFNDDYYHVDSDVVLLEGETHIWRKPVRFAPRCLSCTCIHG